MTSERSAADIHGRDFPAGAVALAQRRPGEPPGEPAWRDRRPRSAAAVEDDLAVPDLKRRFDPEGS